MNQFEVDAVQATKQRTGTINDWDDSRGFGWLKADGQRIFVHIKAFGREHTK